LAAGQIGPELVECVLRAFFADYLRLVEPDAAPLLDLEQITFLDTPLEGSGVAARLPGRGTGERVTALVRVEPEALDDDEVAERIARALARLAVPYGEPVLASVLFLREGRPGVHLDSGVVSRIGNLEVLRLFYTTFGLSTAWAEPFLARPEPLAWAFAALMQPTQRTFEEHQAACLARIEQGGLDDERRALLARVVAGG